jgi:hypothetical protein
LQTTYVLEMATRSRGASATDSLSRPVGQTVHEAANSNLKLLISLRARDGTSVANLFPASVVNRQKMVARDSHPFLSLDREMNRLFDVFRDKLGVSMPVGAQQGRMTPSIDVSETDQEMRISAELPGVNGDDIIVCLVDDILNRSRREEARRESERPCRCVARG